MIRRIALAALVAGGFAAAASAALNPIETRKNMMKTVGASAKVLGDMAKGDMPYDGARAQLAFRTIASAAAGYQFYFPDNSKTGGETEAKATIWENKADFNARTEKLSADALAAVEPAGKDLNAMKGAFQKVAENCKGCHEQYRVQK
jgi:cytochrome c556